MAEEKKTEAPTYRINLPGKWPEQIEALAKHLGMSVPDLFEQALVMDGKTKTVVCSGCNEKLELVGYPETKKRSDSDPWRRNVHATVYGNRMIELSHPNGDIGYICSSCVGLHSGMVGMMVRGLIGNDKDKLNAIGGSATGEILGWLLGALEPPQAPRLVPSILQRKALASAPTEQPNFLKPVK